MVKFQKVYYDKTDNGSYTYLLNSGLLKNSDCKKYRYIIPRTLNISYQIDEHIYDTTYMMYK